MLLPGRFDGETTCETRASEVRASTAAFGGWAPLDTPADILVVLGVALCLPASPCTPLADIDPFFGPGGSVCECFRRVPGPPKCGVCKACFPALEELSVILTLSSDLILESRRSSFWMARVAAESFFEFRCRNASASLTTDSSAVQMYFSQSARRFARSANVLHAHPRHFVVRSCLVSVFTLTLASHSDIALISS